MISGIPANVPPRNLERNIPFGARLRLCVLNLPFRVDGTILTDI